MKILVLNGSPRGKNGATWWVTEKFVEGMTAAGGKVTTIHLSGKKIHHCTGEFACWLKTPGECIHKDDMNEILAELDKADACVLATPVYVDGMTGLLKNCVDRMIPRADPHFKIRDGHCRHIMRKEENIKKIVLVSVCGFPEMDNFDPLIKHIKAICRNMDVEYAGAVLRPGGPLFPELPALHPLYFRIRHIKSAIKGAGTEFVKDGKISEGTLAEISADVISKELYFKHANASFEKTLRNVK